MPTPPPSSPSGPGPGGPPPGWYADPTGAWRWWDGAAWGAAAAAPPSGAGTSTTLAVLSHLGVLLGGFLLPLVILLTADRRDRYLRHHATEGLNFQITVMIASLGAAVVLVIAAAVGVVGLSAGDGEGAAALVGGFAVFWLVLVAVSVGALALGIVGAIRASQGAWWRYPVCLRFVRGPADPAAEAELGAPSA